MSYGRVTPGMLRHMAMLVEMGSADGEFRIEHDRDNEFDYVGDTDVRVSTRYANANLDRYILEFRVSPNAPSRRDVERQVVTVVRSAELPQTPSVPVIVVPSLPPIDYKPAIELFIEIVKVIIRAWTMDSSKIRFGLLEL